MSLVKTVIQPEYEKIRKQILNITVRAGVKPMRLASSREMAKEFGVAHMTVARAMKDLVADGYLTVKPGIGTFTNPRLSINILTGCRKIFGVIIGDGKDAFMGRIPINLTAAFADAMLYHSQNYSLQNCSLVSPLANADEEILKAGFDGVLWICPPATAFPTIKRLKAKGVPMVCAGMCVPIEGVSSIYYDFRQNNREVADLMLAEGRRKIMLVHPTDSAAPSIAGMEDAYSKHGMKFDRAWAVPDPAETMESLDRILDLMKPDGIIFDVGIGPYMKDLRARLDITKDCRLNNGGWSLRKDMGFYGYVSDADLQPPAELAAENMAAQVEDISSAPVLSETMNFKIKLSGNACAAVLEKRAAL